MATFASTILRPTEAVRVVLIKKLTDGSVLNLSSSATLSAGADCPLLAERGDDIDRAIKLREQYRLQAQANARGQESLQYSQLSAHFGDVVKLRCLWKALRE